MGCIYIAKDITKPNRCKIGLTKGTAKKRISQTENPDYVLHYEFPAPDDQLVKIESIIHDYFERKYKRLKHRSSKRKSEWFECTPENAFEILCSGDIRGISPINSETGKFLNDIPTKPTEQVENTARVANTGERYVLQIVGRDNNSTCFVRMIRVIDPEALRRLVDKQNTIHVNLTDLSSYSLVFNPTRFETTMINAEKEVLGRLKNQFVLDGSSTNVFKCSPSKIYQYLTSTQFQTVADICNESQKTIEKQFRGRVKKNSAKDRQKSHAVLVTFLLVIAAAIMQMIS